VLSRFPALCAVALSGALAACTQSADVLDGVTTSAVTARSYGYATTKERECLARAMFFESHRSSREGLVAVGTVVMNRVESGEYPDSICGVVGQKNQFAPGVLSRSMNSKALPDVMAAADSVLAGERHPAVRKAKFFHQAGLKFPYKNMHYVLEAGGNAFYEKRSRRRAASPVTVAESRPLQQGTNSSSVTALSYDIDQKSVDAIGALILSQSRPAVPVR